jgi:hypothetical protein
LPFRSFESSLEERNHFYTGCLSYILGFNFGDVTTVSDMRRCSSGLVVPVSVAPLLSHSLDFLRWSVRGYKLQRLWKSQQVLCISHLTRCLCIASNPESFVTEEQTRTQCSRAQARLPTKKNWTSLFTSFNRNQASGALETQYKNRTRRLPIPNQAGRHGDSHQDRLKEFDSKSRVDRPITTPTFPNCSSNAPWYVHGAAQFILGH